MSDQRKSADMQAGGNGIGAAEVLLEVAQLDLYRLNAFRLTELLVDASTKEVSQRQDMIRKASSIGMGVPPGPGRALPLEEPPDAEVLRVAVQRLTDPVWRLVEELFWFWPQQYRSDQADEAFSALAQGNIEAARDAWQQQEVYSPHATTAYHNLAVLAHLSALHLERQGLSNPLPLAQQQERDQWWQAAYKRWKKLLAHEGFWQQVMNRIADLDDPRLTAQTARQLRTALPQALLLINAQLALSAAEHNATADANRHLALMHTSGLDTSLIDDTLNRVVKPVRDRLMALCKRSEEQAEATPAKGADLARDLIRQAQPMLTVLEALLPANAPALIAMHDEVALRALGCVIVFANHTRQWAVAVEVLKQVVPIARGEVLQGRVKNNLAAAQSYLPNTPQVPTKPAAPPLASAAAPAPAKSATPVAAGTRPAPPAPRPSTPQASPAGQPPAQSRAVPAPPKSQQSERCWFCQKRNPLPSCAIVVTMSQGRLSENIAVPRCATCKAAHERQNSILGGGCVLGLIAGLIAAIAAGGSIAASSGNHADAIFAGIGIFLGIQFGVLLLFSFFSWLFALAPKGTKSDSNKTSYPEVTRRQRQGWKIGK